MLFVAVHRTNDTMQAKDLRMRRFLGLKGQIYIMPLKLDTQPVAI